MAGLSHKNVVRLLGFVEGLENGIAWIVMAWEPNGNVKEFLGMERLEVPERISLILDTFEGLKYLHTRQPPICHGDLKSLNILVSSSYRAVITDFGSARVVAQGPDGAIDGESDGAMDGENDGEATENPLPEQCPEIKVVPNGNELTLTGPSWSVRWAAPEVVDGKPQNLPSDIWSAAWVCWEVRCLENLGARVAVLI
ncbi:hypothetical protein M407DRAFT_67110 [Tulasnella calospora MUT 4182]|uniref:Protein kinase domain-containing protein n=1 Tax=Tulasnella calospora MUT 4182 TaxID=1051891 RepID=A0A0C3MEE4_9AGAM|nr:hypothetical protein M407DRAFT_67110 [Tulasnella calospora MUT 4182]